MHSAAIITHKPLSHIMRHGGIPNYPRGRALPFDFTCLAQKKIILLYSSQSDESTDCKSHRQLMEKKR